MTVVTLDGALRADYVTRGGTNDEALVNAIIGGDEYGLRSLPPLEGWALDIGAHIGSVAIALAMRHTSLNVIAIEPVPDNAEVIRQSAARNGVSDRVHVEEAAAAAWGTSTSPCHFDYRSAEGLDSEYLHDSRFVGNLVRGTSEGTVIDAPAVSLRGLAAKYGVERFRFAKIDCEGCEWAFLGEDADLIDEIVGEWHDAPLWRLVDLLSPTHRVIDEGDLGGTGMFRAFRR